MAHGVTRSELRKVRSIVTLIGEENLAMLTRTDYQCVRGLHVYSSKNENGELALSVWDQPKEKESSRCLFADMISVSSFLAAVDYWRPRYPTAQSY
ncbi:MAG: hypothetical protein ACYCQJ_03165 [Nitrososphaerales archaeon]